MERKEKRGRIWVVFPNLSLVERFVSLKIWNESSFQFLYLYCIFQMIEIGFKGSSIVKDRNFYIKGDIKK